MSAENKVPLQEAEDEARPMLPPPYPGGGPPNLVHAQVVPGTVITTTTPAIMATIITTPQMGSEPSRIICKSCNMDITTRVDRKASMRTHLMAFLLCIFGLWPCVCIPYCVDSCKNVNHYCPNCNAYIGTHKP